MESQLASLLASYRCKPLTYKECLKDNNLYCHDEDISVSEYDTQSKSKQPVYQQSRFASGSSKNIRQVRISQQVSGVNSKNKRQRRKNDNEHDGFGEQKRRQKRVVRVGEVTQGNQQLNKKVLKPVAQNQSIIKYTQIISPAKHNYMNSLFTNDTHVIDLNQAKNNTTLSKLKSGTFIEKIVRASEDKLYDEFHKIVCNHHFKNQINNIVKNSISVQEKGASSQFDFENVAFEEQLDKLIEATIQSFKNQERFEEMIQIYQKLKLKLKKHPLDQTTASNLLSKILSLLTNLDLFNCMLLCTDQQLDQGISLITPLIILVLIVDQLSKQSIQSVEYLSGQIDSIHTVLLENTAKYFLNEVQDIHRAMGFRMYIKKEMVLFCVFLQMCSKIQGNFQKIPGVAKKVVCEFLVKSEDQSQHCVLYSFLVSKMTLMNYCFNHVFQNQQHQKLQIQQIQEQICHHLTVDNQKIKSCKAVRNYIIETMKLLNHNQKPMVFEKQHFVSIFTHIVYHGEQDDELPETSKVKIKEYCQNYSKVQVKHDSFLNFYLREICLNISDIKQLNSKLETSLKSKSDSSSSKLDVNSTIFYKNIQISSFLSQNYSSAPSAQQFQKILVRKNIDIINQDNNSFPELFQFTHMLCQIIKMLSRFQNVEESMEGMCKEVGKLVAQRFYQGYWEQVLKGKGGMNESQLMIKREVWGAAFGCVLSNLEEVVRKKGGLTYEYLILGCQQEGEGSRTLLENINLFKSKPITLSILKIYSKILKNTSDSSLLLSNLSDKISTTRHLLLLQIDSLQPSSQNHDLLKPLYKLLAQIDCVFSSKETNNIEQVLKDKPKSFLLKDLMTSSLFKCLYINKILEGSRGIQQIKEALQVKSVQCQILEKVVRGMQAKMGGGEVGWLKEVYSKIQEQTIKMESKEQQMLFDIFMSFQQSSLSQKPKRSKYKNTGNLLDFVQVLDQRNCENYDFQTSVFENFFDKVFEVIQTQKSFTPILDNFTNYLMLLPRLYSQFQTNSTQYSHFLRKIMINLFSLTKTSPQMIQYLGNSRGQKLSQLISEIDHSLMPNARGQNIQHQDMDLVFYQIQSLQYFQLHKSAYKSPHHQSLKSQIISNCTQLFEWLLRNINLNTQQFVINVVIEKEETKVRQWLEASDDKVVKFLREVVQDLKGQSEKEREQSQVFLKFLVHETMNVQVVSKQNSQKKSEYQKRLLAHTIMLLIVAHICEKQSVTIFNNIITKIISEHLKREVEGSPYQIVKNLNLLTFLKVCEIVHPHQIPLFCYEILCKHISQDRDQLNKNFSQPQPQPLRITFLNQNLQTFRCDQYEQFETLDGTLVELDIFTKPLLDLLIFFASSPQNCDQKNLESLNNHFQKYMFKSSVDGVTKYIKEAIFKICDVNVVQIQEMII